MDEGGGISGGPAMTERTPLLRSLSLLAALLLISTTLSGHGDVRTGKAGDRVIEFPDTAEHQTLVVDLHTHTVFSDGHVWPNIRMAEAIMDGLDAIAVTEHAEYQPHLADIPHPDRNRSYNEATASLPEGSELIVIAGSEITRAGPVGHMNAVFIDDANELLQISDPPEPFDAGEYYAKAGQWPAQEAVDEANDQGGFVFWNHSWSIFRDSKTVMTDFHRQNAANGKLHGIEVANGRTYSEESFQLALDFDLALIGVSDVHNLIDWDYKPHEGGHRPVNLVFAEGKTSAAIREALFAKRTVVWWKNLLLGRERDLAPLLEASMTVESATYSRTSRVLEVEILNSSDARFLLRNTTSYTTTSDHDVIEVAPHEETTLRVRTGEQLDEVKLEFEVLNALIAPATPASVTFELAPTVESE